MERPGVDSTRKGCKESLGHYTRVDWVYDNIGRLAQEDYNADGTALDFTADYLFDLVGNRLEKSVDQGRDSTVDETIDYVYDANDRLLTETKDAAVDIHTVYTYDATQQIAKDVYTDATLTTPVAKTDYDYNLQGRMSRVELDADGNATPETRLDYEYDASGIRVAQTKTVDTDSDGDFSDETPDRTDYLVDHRNGTGYAQVLEEYLNGTLSKSYTIGHDVMAEAIIAVVVQRLSVVLQCGLHTPHKAGISPSHNHPACYPDSVCQVPRCVKRLRPCSRVSGGAKLL